MPVTKKSAIEDKKRQAEQASENQMQDLMAAISGLGVKDSNTFEMNNESEKTAPVENKFKTETNNSVVENNSNISDTKDDKPGYVSLVIPNSLKKRWKLYSAQHSMSLTDCLKLGMKLLEEMEQKGKISIGDGFLTFSA